MKPERPKVGSAILIEHEGKFLLGKRNKINAQGKWIIPGGKVEWGETIEEAGVRELKEETGLDVEIVSRIGHKEIIATEHDYHRIVFFHLGKSKHLNIRVCDDLSDAKFFTIEEIKKLNTVKSVEWCLRQAGIWK